MVKVQLERSDREAVEKGFPDAWGMVIDDAKAWTLELLDSGQHPFSCWFIQELKPRFSDFARGGVIETHWQFSDPGGRGTTVPTGEGLDALYDTLAEIMGRRCATKVVTSIIGLEVPSGTAS